MKKILLFLAIVMTIPQLSFAQGSCSFNANVYSQDPCCMIITAKCSVDNDAWFVVVDGTTTYDASDYHPGFGPNILICFTENGNHTVDFFVNDNFWWTREVSITECGGVDCCQAPDAAGLTIEHVPPSNGVQVCLEEPPCDAEATFRYREIGADEWIYFGNEAFCVIIGVDYCATYEFQAAYYSSECGLTEYSESVEFTSDCPCCLPPDAATLTIEPAPQWGDNAVEVCVLGNECADTEATFRYRPEGSSQWIIFGTGDLCVIAGVDDCMTYEFQVAYWHPECGLSDYSESVTYESNCPTDCCRAPDDVTITPTDLTCQTVEVCVNGFETCDIFGYFVQYRPVGTFSWTDVFTQNSCVTISGLAANQSYQFRVSTASFECGLSTASQILTYNTGTCLTSGAVRRSSLDSGNGNNHSQISNSAVVTQKPKVFPNPFTESVQMAFFSNAGEKYQLDLFDINGKLIRSQKGITEMGYNELRVNDLESLSSGVYIYRLSTESQTYSDRLYKQ